MALSRSTARKNLPPGSFVLKPSGLQIIAQYLGPKVLHGGTVPPATGYVVEGVDVFSVKPGALPFHPSHWRRDGEVWGYFSAAAHPAGDMHPAPGGCWLLYGAEKAYCYDYGYGREVVAFRRRFAFHAERLGDDGRVAWTPTMWLMKEYRLNKDAAVFQRALKNPNADMDCVVRKVFLKPPLVSPRPPSSSSEETGYSSDEDQAMKRGGCSIEGRTSKRARFC